MHAKSWHQKIAILFQMQFLNDIIKSELGFKAVQKHVGALEFLIKTLNF